MADLVSVRTGAFSGTALSLLNGLRSQGIELLDLDLMSQARSVRMWRARVGGRLEARRYDGVSWPRTAAWASANQRLAERRTPLGSHPVLLIQTMGAFLPRTRYVVYTDRVALEGDARTDIFRRTASPGWLARERKLLQGATAVLVMGPSSVPVLVDKYGVPPDRVEVVGAAPNARVAPRSHRAHPRRLLFVGTNWALKGGPVLLDAFRRLKQRRPQLELTIVGCLPSEPLPQGVRVLGRVPPEELSEAFAQADIFVLPTRSEAFGIAFVEALQSGLPCIGSDIANVPWIIGDAGVCVPPDDADAFLRAVDSVLMHYDSWAALARARGARLEDEWSWAGIAQTVIGRLQLHRQPA